MALQLSWIGRPTAFCKPACLPVGYEVESFCFIYLGKTEKQQKSSKIYICDLDY
ncbi:hypothetical protein P700755_003953 [Psychroflexus torquis ATCC 700755]|uniref:Uncharacterized protein n=1 Tax=Psychroflexus torquis (strain ATCC 700755 / CIP 106069 / ACAM 623) TaxID=313595 RepID=K4IJL7_PSYTT|nr:hypothetical protein P700755_003953 [Psychroflexus torquis ATCC 700755]